MIMTTEDKSELRPKAEQMVCPWCYAQPGRPCVSTLDRRVELDGVLHLSRYGAARRALHDGIDYER